MVSHSNAGFNRMKHYDSRVRERYALWKVTPMFLGWRFQGGRFLLSSLKVSETLCTFPIFKVLQTLLSSGFLWFQVCEWDADEFSVFPTGVREEAMGWTMTLKDDFGVIAWTRRAGNYLSLFLLLSLFSFSVQSDIVFPRDHHFSWKTGKISLFIVVILHYKHKAQCTILTI